TRLYSLSLHDALPISVSVIQQDVTDPTQDGLVLAQSPTSGKLKQGSTVTITVGHLVTVTQPPTTTTTTTTQQTTTAATTTTPTRSEEHTSELQSLTNL